MVLLVIVVSDVFGDCCLVMLCVFKINWAARFYEQPGWRAIAYQITSKGKQQGGGMVQNQPEKKRARIIQIIHHE